MAKKIFFFFFFFLSFVSAIFAQKNEGKEKEKKAKSYKKRVLESTEIDFLSSYYTQGGENAAVSGGKGTQDLKDVTGSIIISIPLNDDDVLTINGGVSAYTSASSSNVNPFDGKNPADHFVASSGESQSDIWKTINGTFTHSSNDRNEVLGGGFSFAGEYDYTSLGVSGSFSKLLHEKNTEISIKGVAFFDTWNLIYPYELREHFRPASYLVSGNQNYSPNFIELDNSKRTSYTAGLGFSQILSKKLQGSLVLDFTFQEGLLSTPFQRVHFKDIDDSFIENFHLADDIERLPKERSKVAFGGRLHYYLNEYLVVRTFYRYYFDDWDISSHTLNVELPLKLFLGKITLYPSYRFYAQTSARYFASYNNNLSTDTFYTSDYDLANYDAHQFGFGVSYSDFLGKITIGKIALKSIDLKYYSYKRNISASNTISAFNSDLITLGISFTRK